MDMPLKVSDYFYSKDNITYYKEINFILFSVKSDYTSLTTSVFFFLYIIGVLINSIILLVIYNEYRLHTPMYLFLCNLALVDICFPSTIVPKLLYMLLSGDNTVSFIQCFTQMYFYVFVGTTEDVLISIMAYDRYVAICDPLHYHYILNKKNCILLASGTWISGCLNSILLTIQVSHMSFCHSHTIYQFFCDPKVLLNISCSGTLLFYIVIFIESLTFGVFPAMFTLTSYLKIIRVILLIKSKESRKKAFSTCSSHLTIVIIYYMTCLSAFMMPPLENSKLLEMSFTTQYAIVTPMINPIIYSLRNKDVKMALLRMLGVKHNVQQKGRICQKLLN